MTNLATVLFKLNRMDEVEELLREAYNMNIEYLLPNNRSIGKSLNNLAGFLKSQNRYS
jgi:hypothetical protein